ncbi:MAG TPA: DUF2252 domain-containing protein [Ilumatobacteraceae bacterium]|nr:DUF2252 domain-containing protein [Ilumatobacteraceae bacterium]
MNTSASASAGVPATAAKPSARTRAVVPHLTVAERVARGKAARREVPRSSHSVLSSGPARVDPVALLESQSASRVADLIPIRYGRMLVSPFTFFRGAALVMASDLAGTPRSGLNVQLCGDAHLMNFGAFGSPERRMVFDINDFDETAPGPFEWDVKRLAASVEIAARDNGFSGKERSKVVLAAVESYRTSMAEFAEMTNLEVWYTALDVDAWLDQLGSDLGSKAIKRAEATVAKARTKDSHQAYNKLTRLVDGEPVIISDPPLIEPVSDLFAPEEQQAVQKSIHEMFVRYRESLQSDRRRLLEEFRIVDVARKVVGVGSVGSRAWIVLLLGRDGDDPLFLQAKEAQASVLTAFVGPKRRVANGKRVVEGQHLMQATSDIFLGYTSVVGTDDVKRDYYFRQLRDWKGSAVVEEMNADGLAVYAGVCGKALARAHARSGDRVAIASYLGSGQAFDKAVAEFADLYADQNERDYNALLAAEADGRIEVRRGL